MFILNEKSKKELLNHIMLRISCLVASSKIDPKFTVLDELKDHHEIRKAIIQYSEMVSTSNECETIFKHSTLPETFTLQ